MLALALVSILLIGSGCNESSGEFTEEQQSTYTLSKEGRIDLENVNGSVRIVAWEGNEVQLEAVKRANSHENLKALEIKVDATDDELRIRTIQPSRKSLWGLINRGNSGSVEYSLRVPAHTQLNSISTVNGSIGIENMEAGTKAKTVNGSLNVTSTRGSVQLSTVNGSVKAVINPENGESISLKTVNGSISLALPPGVNADLSASTVNGKVNCDFEVPEQPDGVVGRRLEARLGSGDIPIKIETVNGKITILKTAMNNSQTPVER